MLGGDYQGLGIVRSLGRRGVPVCVIDDERSIARFSRYARRGVRVANLTDAEPTVQALLELARRQPVDGWVLYPTRDEQVEAIAQSKRELERYYRVPTPDWSVTRWACDKRNTYRLAEQLGIPAPRTWYPLNLDDVRAIHAPGPFVIKPAFKGNFLTVTKAKAWRADGNAELVDRFQTASMLMPAEDLMVQELVPGDGRRQFAYCAFWKGDHAVATMVVRRRRQHPPDFGRASTFAETIEHPLLERLSERFLRHLGYYGLAELEYKLDPRDETFKLLDVNARTWGYHTLAYAAGVDFPALLFADQMGEPTGRWRSWPGVRWIRLVTDLPTAWVEMRAGTLSARQYVRSLRGVCIESVLSVRDPLPGVAELLNIPYLIARRGF